MRKILITGCNGFIGTSMAAYLHNDGHEVYGLTIDACLEQHYHTRTIDFSTQAVADSIDEFKPDVIIHAAGSSSVGESMNDPVQDFNSSVKVFLTLLEGVRISRCRPLVVYPSSAAVYGNPEQLPVKECAPLKPISPYGYHKAMGEKIAEEYSSLFSIPVLVIRLFSVFGPYQKKLLVWELFNKFINDRKVVLEGTGEETRDYLSIDALTKALLTLLPGLNGNLNTLNLASGTSISVKELTYKIRDMMGSKKDVAFKNKVRQGDPTFWQADITCLQNLIGNNVNFNFDEALKSCLDKWSIDNK